MYPGCQAEFGQAGGRRPYRMSGAASIRCTHINLFIKHLNVKIRNLEKPYIYRLRPGYGSDKLLLEFLLDSTDNAFVQDLLTTLKAMHPVVNSVEDLWMNDEVLWSVSSSQGAFSLSKDSWGFAFIMAEENQSCLKLIDELLNNSSLFEKEEVDFKKYET